MNDGYTIGIDLKSNLDDCFQYFDGNNYDEWAEDFIDKLYNQLNNTLIKYKNFKIDVDMERNAENIVYIRLWDDNFTEWRDDTKWHQYIQDCEKEKESLLNLINTELVDTINSICSKIDICKFPQRTEFLYNKYSQNFYIVFNPSSKGSLNDIIQLKFEYLDDIDFENF